MLALKELQIKLRWSNRYPHTATAFWIKQICATFLSHVEQTAKSKSIYDQLVDYHRSKLEIKDMRGVNAVPFGPLLWLASWFVVAALCAFAVDQVALADKSKTLAEQLALRSAVITESLRKSGVNERQASIVISVATALYADEICSRVGNTVADAHPIAGPTTPAVAEPMAGMSLEELKKHTISVFIDFDQSVSFTSAELRMYCRSAISRMQLEPDANALLRLLAKGG